MIRIQLDLMIPMRDGVKLYAALYRPVDGERFPVLLIRSPYSTQHPRYVDWAVRFARSGYAVIVISSEMPELLGMCDRVYVMNKGALVENGSTEEIFTKPNHSYTKTLLNSQPKGNPAAPDLSHPTVARVQNLKVWFPLRRGVLRTTIGHIKAVNGVSLSVRQGETLGVVGESGSGKTTLGLAILRLVSSEGVIEFEGKNIQGEKQKTLLPLRRRMQIVFQDPFASLSPRLSVQQIIEEGLKIHKIGSSVADRERIVSNSLTEVGLIPEDRHRYPHE